MVRWLSPFLFLLLFLAPQPGRAEGVSLRDHVCSALLGDDATLSGVRRASYACDETAPRSGKGWLWLRLDPARLASLPAGWRLLVDQTRFSRIAVQVDTGTDSRRTMRSATGLAGYHAPGGVLLFTVATAGRDIRGLYLGFENIDDLSLMRKLVAMTPAQQTADAMRWLWLMGMFAGVLLSALIYNVVIHAGQRSAFQRWYVLWASVAFVYGMVWTNMAALVIPGLAGPWAAWIDYVLIGLMIAACEMFFLTVIEDGMVPGWLARTGRWLAGTSVAAGVMAAADGVLPVMPFDRLLTYTIAGCLVVLAIACGYAIRRGSRIVWLYLIGWAPVIGIFVTRLLRNLGLVGQSDLIDQATFLALGFEALVFSLVIANRFRRLQRQLNHAARKRAMQQAETEALRRAAETDFLTGLGNRAAYHRTVRALVDRGDGFTLWLIDIDHLKQVNDRLGHAAGDALITAIGQALRSLRAEASNLHAARIGGDEFAVVMPGDPPTAAAVLARLAALQGLPWLFEEQQRPLSMSIGSARFPADGRDADMLYHHADLALYTAKNTGRGRHHAYDPLLGILRELQTDFSADGEGALARGEFLLHFQPIVALPGGRPCGYEALLRWDHPIRGLLLPDRFAGLLVSEQVGPRIQYHVLDLAIAWIDRRRDAGMVCVNFTATPLGDPDAVRHILARLAAHDVPPAMLCIEVTEGVMLDRSAEAVLATLTALHDAGVGIALDDFGIGVASLAHLRRMPIDRIKIDRSFVTALDGDGGGAAAAVVVRAIIGLATGLGKAIVAEGIETVAQARLLAEMGCPLGQGFLYGRPVPDGGIAVARPAPVAATSH